MRKPTTKEKTKLVNLVVKDEKVDEKTKAMAKSYLKTLELLKGDIDELVDEGGLSIKEVKDAMEFLQDSFIFTSQLNQIAGDDDE